MLEEASGVSAVLEGPELAAVDKRAKAVGLPYKREGQKLKIKPKP